MEERALTSFHEISHLVIAAAYGTCFYSCIIWSTEDGSMVGRTAFEGGPAAGGFEIPSVAGVIDMKPAERLKKDIPIPIEQAQMNALRGEPLEPMLQRLLAGIEGERMYARLGGWYTDELEERIRELAEDDMVQVGIILALNGREAERERLLSEAQEQAHVLLERHWDIVQAFADLFVNRNEVYWSALQNPHRQMILDLLGQSETRLIKQ
jgi:hypothetical protein